MAGGTLVVSRAEYLFPYYKEKLEKKFGFKDVTATGAEKDGLNMVINEITPRLLLMDSGFYQAGTPYMVGELLKRFPRLNVAIVSMHDYPLSLAVWFIWHGARSYVNWWEGCDEFCEGLLAVRDGKKYISPHVQGLIERFPEWPDTKSKVSRRQMECLILLCCGLTPERIGEELHISRKTVNNHLDSLYEIFHANSREEMVALAWMLELVRPTDIRFYDRKPFDRPLPDWATVKKKTDRRILKFA